MSIDTGTVLTELCSQRIIPAVRNQFLSLGSPGFLIGKIYVTNYMIIEGFKSFRVDFVNNKLKLKHGGATGVDESVQEVFSYFVKRAARKVLSGNGTGVDFSVGDITEVVSRGI